MPIGPDNPAARLHELLTVFRTHEHMSIVDAWAATLKVGSADVPRFLGDVLNLFDAVERLVDEANRPRLAPMRNHLATLRQCVFPVQVTFNTSADSVAPSPTALDALGLLAESLAADAWDQQPDGADISELVAQVEELIATALEAGLPAHIKHLLLDRLGDVLRGLLHLDVGGPDALRRAAESLTMAAAVVAPTVPEESRPLLTRMAKIGRAAWTAVTVIGTVSGGAVALDQIVDLPGIDSGTQPPAQLSAPSVVE